MNPEIKKLWVDALRSGEYKQDQGALHHNYEGEHRYCCLGVLCDLAVKAGVIKTRPLLAYENIVSYIDDDGIEQTGVLPRKVQGWAGLNTDNPKVDMPGYGSKQSLTVLNDSDNQSFHFIADRIEESL